MDRMQFNPSTLRRLRNPVTGRLQRAVAGGVPPACAFCAPNATPDNLRVTFSGLSLCNAGCFWIGPSMDDWGKWNFGDALNGSFILPLYSDASWRRWALFIEGGLRLDMYNDRDCSDFRESTFVDFRICASIYYWQCFPYIMMSTGLSFCHAPRTDENLFYADRWTPDTGYCMKKSNIPNEMDCEWIHSITDGGVVTIEEL